MADRTALRSVAAAALFLVGAAGPLDAQSCIGWAVGGLAERAVAVSVGFAEQDGPVGSGLEAGASYRASPLPAFAYGAGYTHRWTDAGSAQVLSADAAIGVPGGSAVAPGATLCATTGAIAAWSDDAVTGADARVVAIPVGAAIGFVVPAGPDLRLYPYLHPSYVVVVDDDGSGAVSAARAEAGLGFARARLVGRLSASGSFGETGAAAAPAPDLQLRLSAGFRF